LAAAIKTETMNISERLLQGSQMQEYLEQIAQFRLTISKEYLYLYDGRLKDELLYLQHYANHAEAIAIIVSCGNQLAGAVTAIPLQFESEELTSPFAVTSYPVKRVMYVGELLFYPDYRNKGLGTRLLLRIEQHPLSRNNYEYLTSATVMRPEDHPCRPESYVLIDRFLQRNRFDKLPGVASHFTWKEIDGTRRNHEMQFWIKVLVR
jgi:GNAT superfamily N-acetyltransferase